MCIPALQDHTTLKETYRNLVLHGTPSLLVSKSNLWGITWGITNNILPQTFIAHNNIILVHSCVYFLEMFYSHSRLLRYP